MRSKYILLLSIILFNVQGFSQNITINNSIIERKGRDSIKISFLAVVSNLPAGKQFVVYPTIASFADSAKLTPMILSNKKVVSDSYLKRQYPGAITGVAEKPAHYEVVIPRDRWMHNLRLIINSSINGKGSEYKLSSKVPIENQLPIVKIVPAGVIQPIIPRLTAMQQLDTSAPYLYPISEYNYVRKNFDKIYNNGSLIISFDQGETTIDPTYQNNAQALLLMREVLEMVKSDTSSILRKIIIAGAASPEGRLSSNERLAQKRTENLYKYLSKMVDPKLFEIVNLGEDWEKLSRLVKESDILYKDQVLDIITKIPVDCGRETALMNLKNGRPYIQMLKQIFPELRKSGYIKIFYESKPDRNLIDTNRAIELVNNELYAEALEILLTVKQTDVTENLIGVCHMILGNKVQSISYLKSAISKGNHDAAANLDQLLDLYPEVVSNASLQTPKIKDPKTITPILALKTNLLYDAILLPNIELEFFMGKQWSINLAYQCAWWTQPKYDRFYQLMASDLELRCWLLPNRQFYGHFLGLYSGAGYYDLKYNNIGYQSELFVFGGLSYGYNVKLGQRTSMEFELGVGYMKTRYRSYINDGTQYMHKSTDESSWIGPTKAKIALVWRLGNKKRR